MENLNIRSSCIPAHRPAQDEWCKELGVSSAYVKPTQYYQGNELTFKPQESYFSFLNLIKNLFVWTN